MKNEMIYGFFDKADQSLPAFDPGLKVHCAVCGDGLSRPMVTISFLRPGDDKSYFYRIHKECSAEEGRIAEIESAVVDARDILAAVGSQS